MEIYLNHLLSITVLQPERKDKHIWRFSSNGQYSAKLTYEGFFLGATLFAHRGKGFGSLVQHLNVGSLCG